MFKPFRVCISSVPCDEVSDSIPCVNLGTSIANQMYNGVDISNSPLLHGEFDDDDNWEVDPLCDMSSDRMDLTISEPIPSTPSPDITTSE